MKEFDFIIVGAGSAGCVLADRLSENGKFTVCVIEAGGSDNNFWIWMPIGYGRTFFSPKVNWMYQTEPDPNLNHRTGFWPRGKVLGGSSSINAMVYIRGQHADFNDWEKLGNKGWGWQDVLPYFKKSETNDAGGNSFRGNEGPLFVSSMSQQLHPLCENFISASEKLGFKRNFDFNGESQEGVGHYQNTVKNGLRMSASRAFLSRARNRSNVKIIKNAHVTKLLFNELKVSGVSLRTNNASFEIKAKKEVIVSAGSINSPQLLMLSGIGPPDQLKKHNINILHNSPAVGQNLQDHLGLDYYFKVNVPTLNDQLRPWWGKLRYGLQYLLTRRGPLSLGVNQAGGFVKSNPNCTRPNIQLYFNPVSYTKSPKNARLLMSPDPFSGILVGIQPTRPTSRGFLELKSNDPMEPVAIYPNSLSTDKDCQEMIEGSQLLRAYSKTLGIKELIVEEIFPGNHITTEEQMLEDARSRCSTVFHPVGTCSMGNDPNHHVVNSKLKVYGVQNLRVVDASIFPTITSGNTNAPTIMVAEKAADLILDDYRS